MTFYRRHKEEETVIDVSENGILIRILVYIVTLICVFVLGLSSLLLKINGIIIRQTFVIYSEDKKINKTIIRETFITYVKDKFFRKN